MTTLMLQAAPLVAFVTPTMRRFYQRFLHTLDAIAEAKLRHAVPEPQLRKARPDRIALLDWDDFGSRL